MIYYNTLGMAVDNNKLEPNQQAWLDQQVLLRETYPWFGEVDEMPDEKELELLKKCSVVDFNTSCFTEGQCINPSDPRCAKRERK